MSEHSFGEFLMSFMRSVDLKTLLPSSLTQDDDVEEWVAFQKYREVHCLQRDEEHGIQEVQILGIDYEPERPPLIREIKQITIGSKRKFFLDD